MHSRRAEQRTEPLGRLQQYARRRTMLSCGSRHVPPGIELGRHLISALSLAPSKRPSCRDAIAACGGGAVLSGESPHRWAGNSPRGMPPRKWVVSGCADRPDYRTRTYGVPCQGLAPVRPAAIGAGVPRRSRPRHPSEPTGAGALRSATALGLPASAGPGHPACAEPGPPACAAPGRLSRALPSTRRAAPKKQSR